MKQRRTEKEIVQKRALETREKLLKSALKLYTEKGYHSTTVDEIAKNAGLSTGVAYRYFKNKKDMLLAAITYGFSVIKELAVIEVVSDASSEPSSAEAVPHSLLFDAAVTV